MADFSELRNRYALLLCGSGKNDGAKKSMRHTDKLTEQHVAVVTDEGETASESGEPGRIDSVFKRLADMAVSFSQRGSVYYMDKAVAELINDTLGKMQKQYNSAVKPYGNWWYWEIGIPLNLNKIFTLMYDYTDKEMMQGYMAAERHFNDEIKLTGANRVWESVIFAIRGILLGDGGMIRAAVSGIADVMVIVKEGDGFHYDGSFIQHGNFPYNGGYGRSLLQELAPMLYLFAGTEFEIKELDVINKWIENSYFPFMTNGRCMDMVRGREISRCYEQCDFAGASLLAAMLTVSDIEGHKNKRLKACIKPQLKEDFFGYAGAFAAELAYEVIHDDNIAPILPEPYFRAFNSMDRAVKHGKDYSIGLAMHSERIANYESINDENTKAYHTSDGMLYTYKPNEPWADFFWQTIDLNRLPGTTVLKNTEVKPNTVSKCDFVGGCGMGENGVCAMELNPVGYNLRANKAWFFFDNEIVCLGSGITSSDDINVETIIENRLIADNSRFTVCGKKAARGYNVKGAYLDGRHDIGYYFPEEQHVYVLREVREGKWDRLNVRTDGKTHSGMYITMWIDHGKNIKDASYEYIMIPKCSEEELKGYDRNRGIDIIENSAWIQCVNKGNVTGIIFLRDKTRSAAGVACDKRSIVMTNINNGGMDFVITDPTHKHIEINIELDYSAKKAAECDERIEIIQLSPYIIMKADVRSADGKELRVRLEGIEYV